MVGTRSVSVTSCCSIARHTETGSNIGTMTWVVPTSWPKFQAATSARWNIGAACSRRPVPIRRCVVSAARPLTIRLSWLSMTPFGAPVVPPV